MTNNIEEPKPSNRKLWLILAGVSVVLIGCTLTAFGVTSNPSPNMANPSQTATAVTVSDKAPTIETVETTATAKELTFAVKVKDVDTAKWSIDYEVADQDRVVKSNGNSKSAEFQTSVPLSNSAYYRIKTRAVNKSGQTTDWSESYTVKLSELKGFTTIQPSPDFYQTGWATGNDISAEGAKKAINIAWGTTEITRQEAVTKCLPINSGEMTSKLLLPPIPSVMPSEVVLKYMTNSWNGSALSITYLWCEK